MNSALDYQDNVAQSSSTPGQEPKSEYKLEGNMGVFDLLFTVLAFAAPLGVVFGFLSYNIGFGIGVPIAFLGVTALILLFAVGFTNMTRKVPRPGAFYTYIAEGLGRPTGLGASFLALAAYGFNIVAALVFSGIGVNNFITSFWGDMGTPWWIWSLMMLAIVWALSYFNVEFSAKILSVVLVLEITVIVIFDIVILANGGPEGHTLTPWRPSSLATPTLGLLLLFSVGLFNGFEATAIYRDEVRDPVKTIPRATYLTILFLGIFYAISSYALIISTGESNAVSVAQKDPAGMMPAALLTYLGVLANQIVAVLLLSSMFASTLSLQNILSRYTHSLSVDGVLPHKLAAVHVKHGSPHISAVAVGFVLLLIMIALIMSGAKDISLYGASVGIAFYGMIMLLFMTSLAVLVFFRRRENRDSFWKTFIAPLVSAIGIGAVLIIATQNIELLITAPPIVIWSLVAITYLSVFFGIAIALTLRLRGSAIYDRIGRRVD